MVLCQNIQFCFCLFCFTKISVFSITYFYSMSYKTIFSYFFALFISFIYFILVFSNIFTKIDFSSYYYFTTFLSLFAKPIFLYNIKNCFFCIFTTFSELFLFPFLANVYLYNFFLSPTPRAKRQVQRRVKSASVSETTSRVRCNVCSTAKKITLKKKNP